MRLWILDVNQEVGVIVGRKLQEILLWGITEEGERVLVVDRFYKPFFYAVPRNGVSAEALASKFSALLKPYGLEGVEVVKRKRLGRPIEVVKLIFSNADDMEKAAKQASKHSEVSDIYEEDIRPSQRYFEVTDLSPSSWVEVDVAPGGDIEGVELPTYVAKEPPKPVNGDLTPPPLRCLAFHVIIPVLHGSPDPKRDSIGVLAAVTDDGREYIFAEEDDRIILFKFAELVREYDPDVVISWAANSKVWPFLVERSKTVNAPLLIGRQRTEPHQSLFGHFSIIGRINVDAKDFAEDDPEIKIKTLEYTAKHYKIWDGEVIEEVYFGQLWKTSEGRKKLEEYALKCARTVMKLWHLFADYLIQLSALVGYPMDHVVAASPGFRVEEYLIRHAAKIGELVPKRPELMYFETYKGGMVLQPRPGIHEDVAVLDFAAMYPHLILKYNISPDTYVPPEVEVPKDKVYVAPEVGHRFLKQPDGLYRVAVGSLIEARKAIRQEMKKYPKDSPRYLALEAQQKAVKVVTNATYGYAGWTGARWYMKPVAESCTAWGRSTISAALSIARELGLTIIYGDTDSLFLKYDPEKIEKFIQLVEERLGLEIKVDKVYKKILFTEAKKRYAGLLEDGSLDIVGLEAVRGDWCEAAKELQEKVAEILLKTGSKQKAISYVHDTIRNLKSGKIPAQKLVIWKTLSKPLEEYKVSAPHVAVAWKLKEEGWAIKPGDQIGFVVHKGGAKVYERAVPYHEADPSKVDYDYYIDNQLIPVAHRILQVVGVTTASLKPATMTRGLLDFM
ncbi:MAG: DNA polymerase II [Candidatus Verstraetearchaeota archaeon]|nr:DNA polymerase II [Candidatus Verstraetearchaeota archaeon]